MNPTLCLLWDIRAGKIIGHDTKHNGLYYIDEVTRRGDDMLVHRQLGHPPPRNLDTCFRGFLVYSVEQTTFYVILQFLQKATVIFSS